MKTEYYWHRRGVPVPVRTMQRTGKRPDRWCRRMTNACWWAGPVWWGTGKKKN